MSKFCELTGKRVMVGCNVSHANRHTKRRFLPNLRHAPFWSPSLRRKVRLRVCAAAVRALDFYDDFDDYLVRGARCSCLSARARKMRSQIVQARAAGGHHEVSSSPLGDDLSVLAE